MGQIIKSGSSGYQADVDANKNLQVNLPTNAALAGYTQLTQQVSATEYKRIRASYDGEIYTVEPRLVFEEEFNSTSAAYNPRWGTNATTMTAVAANGWIRLNNSAITTTTTGISMYTNRVFRREEGGELRLRFKLKTGNATASNKQADFGLGYYAFAAGQAAAMNEFIGFRFTTGGGFQGVLESSTGGAPTTQTININSNVPYADTVFREYEIILSDTKVEFWTESTVGSPLVLAGTIVRTNDNFSLTKGNAYPIMLRVFNSGTASAAATFDIGSVALYKYGGDNVDVNTQRAAMGKSSFYAQPDLIVASTNPHLQLASATSPTTRAINATTQNAFNVNTQMGGIFQITGSAITATVDTDYMVVSFQNFPVPTTAGAALNVRNFICTGISIQPLVCNVVVAGGGFVASWWIGIGSTAISLATADANGTTAVAQKAPRIVPLSTVDVSPATQAAGTVMTRTGDSTHIFSTPLVVCPNEFLHIGFRTRQVAAAVTSGNFVGGIFVQGYWE